MGIVHHGLKLFEKVIDSKKKHPKIELRDYLEKLQILESRLWKVTINDIASNEDNILEDTNHLIYLINHRKENDTKVKLRVKEVSEFLEEIKSLQGQFTFLKNMVRSEDRLRRLISEFSVRLVNKENYDALREVFILESQLYDVLEVQDNSLRHLIYSYGKIKFDEGDRKVDIFLDTLYKLREILAGHMEFHTLWEEERSGYSNASNIISSLIKKVKDIDMN